MNLQYWPALSRGVVPTVEHLNALKSLNPRTIIDVGANKGQFSVLARSLFPQALIHAFEPLKSERQIYESVVSKPVQIYSVALGATKGTSEFFVASRADSSSLYAPSQRIEAAYGVVLASKKRVQVERLDNIMDPSSLVGPVLLKIDVQGGELEVLKGSTKILPQVNAIYCEVSFVELYEKQSTVSEIVSFLDKNNFSLRGVFNLSNTKQYGLTQADFLFVPRS